MILSLYILHRIIGLIVAKELVYKVDSLEIYLFGVKNTKSNQCANFLSPISTLKLTFAPKASKTFIIVSNLAFFTLFSILDI